MNQAKISKALWPILESMSASDIINGYFGGSNLTAEYLNDYSSAAINRFIADWIDDNPRHDLENICTFDLLENSDYLLQVCAAEFCSALTWILGGDRARAEWLLRHASMHFEPWGKFYVFANADIACSFIIRASDESEALQDLLTRFESAFAIEESDASAETIRNDNGTPCNIDYLSLVGTIEGAGK